MNEEEYPTPTNPIPIEKETKIIKLEKRDPQSEAKYWNQKYTETLLKLLKEKEKNKKLEVVADMMVEDICIYATENHYNAVRRNFGNDGVYIRPKETMKEYYFKKARGEINETN